MGFIKQLVRVLKFFGIILLIMLVIVVIAVILSVIFVCFDREDLANAVVDKMEVVLFLPLLVLAMFAGLKKEFGTNQTPRTNKTSETKKTERYYCKWCGYDYSSIRLLTNNRCNKNPNSNYHEPYEGSEKAKYCCKWCGYDYSSIRLLTNNRCNKNPNGEYHEPER